MFLSWWRGLIASANPQASRTKADKRLRIPRKFRAAMRVEQLEDRLVPASGQANVFLNLQNATAQLNTVTAARSTTVPVFIDFDSVAQGTSGGVGGGTFYVLYDPNVLSISETATSVGPDIKPGSLISSMPAFYTLAPATGFSTGVVAVGLNHGGTTFLTGAPSGHLIELDFHVVQTASLGNSTLLDLQSVFVDANGNLRPSVIHDQGGTSYAMSPAPSNYAAIGTTGNLTQAGPRSPNTIVNPFSPNDSDSSDAAIQIVAQAPNLAPTAVADTYNMAPNNANFTPTLTVAGLASGVLGNDSATANGPMSAVLTGGSATSVTAQASGISSVTESGLTVTVTTTASMTMQVGEEVTLAGVPLPPQGTYNGTFVVSGVLSPTQFTYQSAFAGMPSSAGGTVTNVTQTLYSAATPHGTVTLNANDGSLAYTPAANYSGTDTFTYQAVDAVSNTPSAPATVTVYVGGYLSIPQNLTAGAVGSQLVVPVNILDPNPANSGGLDGVTFGINYDATVFSVASVTNGSVPTNAGWGGLTANTTTPGSIIITTGATGGALPVSFTTGGSLALITFNVIGLPSSGNKSVVNLAATSPQTAEIDVAGTGSPVSLPFAVAPVDNTNFNGSPGTTDGLVIFAGTTNTTTTVSAAVGGSAVTTVTYGTPVTLTATIAPSGGGNAPGAGSVDFKDGANDLGTVSTESVVGSNAVFTLITTVSQLQVLQAGGGIHTITAIYSPSSAFSGSTGTLAGGLAVTPASLTITASTNAKTYDSTTSAVATPTVAGLVGSDTVTGLAETYTSANAGTSKTLNVSAYTVNDGNGGKDYTVTTVSNTTGVINQAALTITATTNTKGYDSLTSAAAAPTVAGLKGGDTVTGLAEVYSNANAGTSKTLSVSTFTVNDGNGGNNYATTTVVNTTGVINKTALTITASTNTKTYDATTSALATPTVAGLVGGDTTSGLTEVYADANVGSGKTLSVSAFSINDGNSGNNYAVTTVASTTGLINKAALTITARPNTKVFDGTTTAQVTPTVSGLQGTDTVTGLTEVYSDATVNTGKTLSVSAYTVNDGNSGNNYSVATVINNAGVINPLPGKALISLDVGAGVTAVTATRSSVVKVFIDFDNHTAAGTSTGSNGGLAGGSFYVLYDPSVLTISETAAASAATSS